MLIKNFKLDDLSFEECGQGAYVSAAVAGIELRKAKVLLTRDGAHLENAAYRGFTTAQEKDIDTALTKEILFAIVCKLSEIHWKAYRPMTDVIKRTMERKGITAQELKTQVGSGQFVDDLLYGTEDMHFTLSSVDIETLARELGLAVMDLLQPVVQGDAHMYQWALECCEEILDMKTAEYLDLYGSKTIPIGLVNAMDTGHTLLPEDLPEPYWGRLGLAPGSYQIFTLSDGSIVLRPGSHRCICCNRADGVLPHMGKYFCPVCCRQISRILPKEDGNEIEGYHCGNLYQE